MDSTPRDEPDQVIPPPKVYARSVSQLKMYRQCGLQWKKVKFDKVPRQPAAWLAHGTAFGKTVEEWEISGRTISDTGLELVYNTSYDGEIERYLTEQPNTDLWLSVGRTKVENDIANRRERGLQQFFTYRDRVITEPWRPWELPDGAPAVEVGFYVDLGFGPIRAYIDLVKEWEDGRLVIVDFKTGNREKTALQLGVYRLLFNHTFGLDVTDGAWYYAKDDTWSEVIDLTPFSLEYVKSEFEAMERGINNRVFLANPGDHCALCPARGECIEVNAK